jgi:hypothetical protein
MRSWYIYTGVAHDANHVHSTIGKLAKPQGVLQQYDTSASLV